jgi:RNA polymerase-binding transcription factor DksA
MNADSFLSRQRQHLNARRDSKKKILEAGGEQSLIHSPQDLTRIDFALKRIDDGQYGLCTNCGCEIEIGRLEAIPEAPFCTACATEIETQ